MNAGQPIGIFDSGVGGLTVAHALRTLLPNEKIIYFGDTAHLPYGDKSEETIRKYVMEIGTFLSERNCKVILIACNSASSVAFEPLKDRFGEEAVVFNVIDPVVSFLKEHQTSGKVGVIGTKATIFSEAYEKRIHHSCPGLQVVSLATPLLVPMIEEGFVFDDISNAIIRAYLSRKQLAGIESLILGCTHYPIIKNQIDKFYNFEVEILDSARIVAEKLKNVLQESNLLNTHAPGRNEFFVSDYTDHFEKIARMFFEESIRLKRVRLPESPV